MVDNLFRCGFFATINEAGECVCTYENMTYDKYEKNCLCKNGKGNLNCDIDVCEIAGTRMCKLLYGYYKCGEMLGRFASNVRKCDCSELSYDRHEYDINHACGFTPPPTTQRYYGSTASNDGDSSYKSESLSKNNVALIALPIGFVIIFVLICAAFKNRFRWYARSYGYGAPIQQTTEIMLSTPSIQPAYTISPHTYNPPGQRVRPNAPDAPLMPYGTVPAPMTQSPGNWHSNTGSGPGAPFRPGSSNYLNEDGSNVALDPPPAYNEIYK